MRWTLTERDFTLDLEIDPDLVQVLSATEINVPCPPQWTIPEALPRYTLTIDDLYALWLDRREDWLVGVQVLVVLEAGHPLPRGVCHG